MVTAKKYMKMLERKFGAKVYAVPIVEDRRRVILFEARAKKGTPRGNISAGTKSRLHIGTYVPSTGRRFIFSSQKRYVVKKR